MKHERICNIFVNDTGEKIVIGDLRIAQQTGHVMVGLKLRAALEACERARERGDEVIQAAGVPFVDFQANPPHVCHDIQWIKQREKRAHPVPRRFATMLLDAIGIIIESFLGKLGHRMNEWIECQEFLRERKGRIVQEEKRVKIGWIYAQDDDHGRCIYQCRIYAQTLADLFGYVPFHGHPNDSNA